MVSVNEVRRTFLDYFKKQGHEILPSGPLVPKNDPTLMFANAGMNQFKDIFTGKETPAFPRAVTAQKCVRAGGKHNDLENVGFTKRHHTFFEMLGNFSFGDYFKEEAISHAWHVVTKEFDLPKDRLLVTVFAEDDEAFGLWKKIAGLSDDKIIRIATSDNFWSMGDTGPCGPCSEIFYDHGDHIPGGPPGAPDEDGDRFIEIWNNVFMQFEQVDNETRVSLPKPSIDTGMGLERISATLMGTNDNYAIDLIRDIIEDAAHKTDTDPDGVLSVSHRVIADHLRAASFLIAGGILPSNEGRGYVLRRIMRRGMRHAHILGAEEPLMYRLAPGLIQNMGDAYPELHDANALIVETLKLEEQRFKKTLEKGLSLLEAETRDLPEDEKLSGAVAFKLYDTYGFPLDLTQDVLRREQGRDVDMDGFDAAMTAQKEQARASWKGSGADAANEKLWFDIKERVGVTDFMGYETDTAEAKALALLNDKGDEAESLTKGQSGILIVNQTPFYGESGGQIGDSGYVTTETGRLTVTDTQRKLGSIFAHYVTCDEGSIKIGDTVTLEIDKMRRDDIRANHSATHLLHAALRRNLGMHVTQKGSLVAPDRLRFDISQPKPLTQEEIHLIEDEVNTRIRMNTPVSTRLLPVEQAREEGAIAMFGEKYDEEVRVLTMGGTDPDNSDRAYSMELCGGTHVRRTGDIGLLKIIGESAVSSGVRRIEALTGRGALAYLNTQEERLDSAARILKTTPAEVGQRIESLLTERKKLDHEISDLRRKLATGGGEIEDAAPAFKNIGGIKFVGKVLEGIPARELKPMADDLKAKMGSGVVTLIAVNEGKASIVVGVTDDLTSRINAVDLVRIASEKLGGTGGGGRPDMAQAGGPDAAYANDAVGSIEQALAG